MIGSVCIRASCESAFVGTGRLAAQAGAENARVIVIWISPPARTCPGRAKGCAFTRAGSLLVGRDQLVPGKSWAHLWEGSKPTTTGG